MTLSGLRHERKVDVVIVAAPTGDIDALAHALVGQRLVVERADGPESVARAVVAGRADVVVVDLRAGDLLADRILSWLATNATATPVVITEQAGVDDRLWALKLGASEHLIAPFDTREAVARIDLALARRRGQREAPINAGDIVVDVAQQCAVRMGQRVPLTRRELDVLVCLIGREGALVSKQEILQAVWGSDARTENVVEANVSSLRRKLHSLGPAVIHTVHRKGYVFRGEPDTALPSRHELEAERQRLTRVREDVMSRRDEIVGGHGDGCSDTRLRS